MSQYNAILHRVVHNEQMAAALYFRARELGVEPTRRWIGGELERLQAHSAGCRCALPCQLARGVSAARIHWIAQAWVRSQAATQRLARR